MICEIEGCETAFKGYPSSRLRRRIEPEEYVRTRRQENKPILCVRHLQEEMRAELGQ